MIFYIDGGCSGNNQKKLSKRKMVSVVADKNGIILAEITGNGGSNNIAEFLALEAALQFCLNNKVKRTEIITDSQNNIHWFRRLKKKGQNDYERVAGIKRSIDAMAKVVEVNLIWKPREENLAGQYIENKYKL